MRKFYLLLLLTCSLSTAKSQIIFKETFDGISGPIAGGAGTYSFPPGWMLRNVDNRIPAGAVSYVNEAWERREDFQNNVADSCAFSTSWYSPAGGADDWMWTPLIGPLPANSVLKWNARTYDPLYQDGYEVRIMTSAGGPPTGGTGVMGNQVINSTLLYSTGAESSGGWIAREVSLAAYTGQSVYVAFRNISNDKFLLVIDNVSVEVVTNHDAQLLSFVSASEYSKIPVQQASPLSFVARIRNNGAQSITNVSLTAKVYNSANTEVFTTTGPTATLAANGFADFTGAATFTPSLPDYYRVEYTANLTEADDAPANNTLTSYINITDTIYARDTSAMTGSLGIGAGNGGYLGQQYVVTNADLLTSVSMFINEMPDPTNVGMAVFAYDNGKPTTLLYSAPAITIPGLTPAAWYTFSIDPGTGLTILPDTIVVAAVEIDNTLAVGLTNDKFTNGTVWVNWPTSPLGGWGNIEQFGASFAKPFMIRANFGTFCTSAADVTDPADQEVCNGAATTAVAFTGTQPGTIFNWTNNTPSIGLPMSGSGDIASFTAVNTGTAPVVATITVTPNDGTCNGTPQTFTITINHSPVATATPATQNLTCSGSAISTIVLSGSGTTYNWTRDNTVSVTGIAASGTGDINGTLNNTTAAPVTVTFTITPTLNGCVGTTTTATVVVEPSTGIDPVANQTICNGGNTTAISFTSPTAGTTFNWVNNTISIGLAASGTGDIASFVGTNTTNAPVTASITVTPVAPVAGSTLVPELLYYKFNGTGTSVPNLATAPPTGAENATLMGGSTQGGSAICNGTVIGTGASSTNDYVNTNWLTNLTGTSWTISFKTSNIPSSTSTQYIFGDVNAGGFRCFTGGVANPGNWILRGSFTDILLPGGASTGTTTNTFVYDMVANEMRAYLNGVLVNTIAQGAVNINGPGPFKVAGYSSSASLPAGGQLDEFKIFSRALTDAEVLELEPCSTTTICPGTPQTFTITVNPTPTVNAVSNQTICNNSNTTVVNFSGAVTGTDYNWTNDNPSIGLAASGTGNIASFVATNTGTAPVTATITVTPGFTNGGSTCTGTPTSFIITVNPTATVNVVANQTLCNNSATTAVAFSGAVTGTVFNWTNNTTSIGLAASGTGDIASFTATNTGTAAVTATITVTPSYTNGSTTCTGTPRTFTITVNPVPTVTCPANITVSNGTGICGAIVNYPAATATGSPAPTITYSVASGSTFPVGTTTVLVTATNTCGVATCSFTVTVNDTQAPTITCPSNITQNTDAGICTATVITPNATTADNCVVTKLTWALTGATTGTSAATGINNIGTRTFNMGVTTATYTISDAAGNTSTCSFTITVNDGQLPAITAQPTNKAVCVGSNVIFSVTAINAVSYQWQQWTGSSWSNVGTSAPTLTLNAVTLSQNTNTYRVIVTGTCSSVTSGAASLNVNPIPTINLVPSMSPVLLPSEILTINANTNPSGGNYAWFKNGTAIPGTSGASLGNITVDNAGSYRVTYTDLNGCIVTSSDLVVSAEASSTLLLVTPNPNDGHFQVRFYNQPNEVISVSVYDQRGARVYYKSAATNLAYTGVNIDISKHPTGVYLVE
jgi:hypothetical protein